MAAFRCETIFTQLTRTINPPNAPIEREPEFIKRLELLNYNLLPECHRDPIGHPTGSIFASMEQIARLELLKSSSSFVSSYKLIECSWKNRKKSALNTESQKFAKKQDVVQCVPHDPGLYQPLGRPFVGLTASQ